MRFDPTGRRFETSFFEIHLKNSGVRIHFKNIRIRPLPRFTPKIHPWNIFLQNPKRGGRCFHSGRYSMRSIGAPSTLNRASLLSSCPHPFCGRHLTWTPCRRSYPVYLNRWDRQRNLFCPHCKKFSWANCRLQNTLFNFPRW